MPSIYLPMQPEAVRQALKQCAMDHDDPHDVWTEFRYVDILACGGGTKIKLVEWGEEPDEEDDFIWALVDHLIDQQPDPMTVLVGQQGDGPAANTAWSFTGADSDAATDFLTLASQHEMLFSRFGIDAITPTPPTPDARLAAHWVDSLAWMAVQPLSPGNIIHQNVLEMALDAGANLMRRDFMGQTLLDHIMRADAALGTAITARHLRSSVGSSRPRRL